MFKLKMKPTLDELSLDYLEQYCLQRHNSKDGWDYEHCPLVGPDHMCLYHLKQYQHEDDDNAKQYEKYKNKEVDI